MTPVGGGILNTGGGHELFSDLNTTKKLCQWANRSELKEFIDTSGVIEVTICNGEEYAISVRVATIICVGVETDFCFIGVERQLFLLW